MVNSHDFVSCMLYWIHLVVCERSTLCGIVYFALQNLFFFLDLNYTTFEKHVKTYTHFFHSYNLIAWNQYNFWKHMKKMCINVSNVYMKIINNKHTLLYNLPTIHSIQQYNSLCELSNNCVIEPMKLALPYFWKKSTLFYL